MKRIREGDETRAKGSEAKTYVTEYGQDMGYTNGQDMGYSFEQSRGCERTAKEHYFGVS
jgi:hypothetical protein